MIDTNKIPIIKASMHKVFALGELLKNLYTQKEQAAGKQGVLSIKLEDYIRLLRDSMRIEFLQARKLLQNKGIIIESDIIHEKKASIRQVTDIEMRFVMQTLAELENNKNGNGKEKSPEIIITDSEM